MKTIRFLSIMQLIAAPESYKCQMGKYRIVETNLTVDGFRSRIADGIFNTLEEAQHAMKEYESRDA